MEEGYTQKICFCRVHGTFVSQTLPRQTSQQSKPESPMPVRQNYGERKRVIQNSNRGAFNNLESESIEDLTNKFNRITHHDCDQELNLTTQSIKTITTDDPELCSYRHYDTVDQDIHINPLEPIYVNNTPINNQFHSEFAKANNPKEIFTSPSFLNYSDQNYYDPVSFVSNEFPQMAMEEGVYLRSNQHFTQTLPLDTIRSEDICRVANNKSTSYHSKSKDRKSRRRKDTPQGAGTEEALRDSSEINQSYSSSHSAPTSPAQKASKSRRHHRDTSSHKSHHRKARHPNLGSSSKPFEAKTLEHHWMNKKSSSNYYNNINLPNNLKFRPHSKSNDLISPTEVVGLLPNSLGDERSAIPSLVSPAHRALKNRSSQKSKQKHDRKKRRSSRYRDGDLPQGVTGCCGRSLALKKSRSRGVSKSYSALNDAVDCLDFSSGDNDPSYDSPERKDHSNSTKPKDTSTKEHVGCGIQKNNYQPSHCVKNLVSWVSSVGNKVGKETMAFIDTLPSIKEDYHIVTIGLDSAGKTTVLYRLKFDQYVNTVPTIGFNCEKVKGTTGRSKNLTFLIWDVGGQEKLRPLWRPYTRATDAIIFVVDSCDTEERLEEAKLELHRIMRTQDNIGVPLLIIANKQDLPSSKSQNEIEKCLGMTDFNNDQLWHIEPACAVTGEGLESALEALHTLIIKRKQQKKRARNKTR